MGSGTLLDTKGYEALNQPDSQTDLKSEKHHSLLKQVAESTPQIKLHLKFFLATCCSSPLSDLLCSQNSFRKYLVLWPPNAPSCFPEFLTWNWWQTFDFSGLLLEQRWLSVCHKINYGFSRLRGSKKLTSSVFNLYIQMEHKSQPYKVFTESNLRP